jgi:putative DNA primase/helicase
MFIQDEKWEPEPTARTSLRDLYSDYKVYCAENGYKALGRNKFGKRLEGNGFARMDLNKPVFLIARGLE